MSKLQKEFEENGVFIIPNALSSQHIKLLINATEAILGNERYAYDFLRLNKNQHIHKIKYMFEKDNIFCKTLVHSSILAIIQELAGEPESIVPTWEDMLIKVPYSGIPVNVHQDLALQSTKSDIFSIGIYLHNSYENPVNYLLGSHKLGALTKDELYEVYHRERDKFTAIKVNAGDIVVHNVKTLHFSEENFSKQPRYTWYLEFRTKDQLIYDSPWNQEWIQRRRAIWVDSLIKYNQKKEKLIPDYEELRPYLNPLQLRISHTNEDINYDMSSPYNHFS